MADGGGAEVAYAGMGMDAGVTTYEKEEQHITNVPLFQHCMRTEWGNASRGNLGLEG